MHQYPKPADVYWTIVRTLLTSAIFMAIIWGWAGALIAFLVNFICYIAGRYPFLNVWHSVITGLEVAAVLFVLNTARGLIDVLPKVRTFLKAHQAVEVLRSMNEPTAPAAP